MPRLDFDVTPSVDRRLQELGYLVADWSSARSNFPDAIKKVLSHASKCQNNKPGFPDRIYLNESEKLLILVEEKPHIKDHDVPDITKGAVSGVRWYLSRFLNQNLPSGLRGYFDNWKILGIAVSGDLSQEYLHKFNCFNIDYDKDCIISMAQVTNFMTEPQFLAIFNTLDEEKAIASVSNASKKINQLLRSIDSQKRPVLLSALMICLHKGKCNNDFPEHYKTYSPDTLVSNLLTTAVKILKKEGVPAEKLDVLETELAFLRTDTVLNNSDILKQILDELQTSVIPLFNNGFASTSNYDIIGKFYEEFLKYAGVSNVKKGIVLTPRHITTLFTELIDLKENDKIVDLCCGTGAFLIAGMNAIINKISKSGRSDKQDSIKKVIEQQLLGFEINPTMYICAISNMLFRGDGKSSIFNYDSINDERTDEILRDFGASVGFINPPYSGKENKEDPTPKEITFLIKLLDNCSRYGIIIAPLSVYFKDEKLRENILKKHTLKSVINMPVDLFQPNAAAHTAIAVFETHRAFDYENDEVLFMDLADDGFVLSKNKGRSDVYNRWLDIKRSFLKTYKTFSPADENKNALKRHIKKNDEWIIYAYAKTDYSTLCEKDFIDTIRHYLVFKAKEGQELLDRDIDEISMIELLLNYYGDEFTQQIRQLSGKCENICLDYGNIEWKEFKLTKIFDYKRGTRLVKAERIDGSIPLVTAGFKNGGVAGYIAHDERMDLFENRITLDMFGNVFYEENKFFCDDNIIAIKPVSADFNRYSALFIATVLKKLTCHFDYGRQYRLKHFEKQYIKLPAIKNSQGQYEPDWQFMEKYIKSLPCSDLI